MTYPSFDKTIVPPGKIITHFRNPRGNVAVTVALSLTMLLTMMAFTLDTGYLVLEKNSFQNAVEAAAMAGAGDLCGDDPIHTARIIARQNGITDAMDEEVLTVQLGYYDENDVYEDFSIYKDFEADTNPETPQINEAVQRLDADDGDQYNNAVLVYLKQPVKNLSGGLMGEPSVPLEAAAVGYLARYGMMALGEDGIKTTQSWGEDYPTFKDMAIHSNGDITFYESTKFEHDSPVTATGTIGEKNVGTEGTREIEIPPVDWDYLYQQAETNGDIYHPEEWKNFQWKELSSGNNSNEGKRNNSNGISFSPGDGDHRGKVYYFVLNQAYTIYIEPSKWHLESFNFSLAFEKSDSITIQSTTMGKKIIVGGKADRAVFIFSNKDDNTGDFVFQDRLSCGEVLFWAKGVFIRHQGVFQFSTCNNGEAPGYQSLRVIADSIEFEGGYAHNGQVTLDGIFSPPCPPNIVRLGNLVLGAE